MCSLFGWLDYEGILPDKMKKKLTQALANAAEERGTDAAGISYIKDGKVTIFKRPKPAHKIHFNAPEGTMVIMGHTRMTTQGDEKHNYNNHPFSGNVGGMNFALAHNGVLYNDKQLRKDLNLPDTHIETDSYVAVQLIEQSSELSFDSLRNMSEKVQGSFCFSVLDEMGKLYIIKGSNPMTINHIESLGLYVYASTQSILTKALKKVGLNKFSKNELKMTEGDILCIDRNGEITHSEFEPKIYRSKFGNWYDYDEYYSAYEQTLIEMANMYGSDEKEISLLLEWGYTVIEIEEMLMDNNLLQEALRNVRYMCGEDVYESYCGAF